MELFSLEANLRPRCLVYFGFESREGLQNGVRHPEASLQISWRMEAPKLKLVLVAVVYLSLFLDNVLLTVVVPIIPDYLCSIGENSTDENGRVGLLLSSKALVQLLLNPFIGSVTSTVGYFKPLFIGNLCLILAAVLFAFGRSYEFLFLARSIQGVSSACIGVSGMSMVAAQYADEGERSKVMGFVLGSIALGVLVGYPIGSILYDIEGKMAPFLLISSLILIPLSLQIFLWDTETNSKIQKTESNTSWIKLLLQGKILIIAGAILCSTSPMAILEPCLPIWLQTNIKPKKWQLGMVFIPDSVGYLLGTNCFGMTAYRYGRCKTAVLAMALVGISVILLPTASTMGQLVIPHLGMGLGIGIADAALVPLLASLVDQDGNYGPVYSIQQVAVSLAYSLGPIVGSELVRMIGFQWVMRIVGLINLAYCPLLIYLAITRKHTLLGQDVKEYSSINKTSHDYERFQDDDDL
ncbi:Similar to Slc18a2: Synaptic vesicular amine transporter (Rattus norvegicus) [Cotesia congregata]|uniref:Similar to Slc18a2: Synaptic vesicular amine transporter (Rattus norvegicus) n=1 Tax=Cotesia congregata TaxID=51543 RepID=A0A8J2ECY0_COTCN|nr:Similar to Slc18a2: Synaptic vesicular amine transporter (Rattus norvegicus) [Cotesia congregata]